MSMGDWFQENALSQIACFVGLVLLILGMKEVFDIIEWLTHHVRIV